MRIILGLASLFLLFERRSMEIELKERSLLGQVERLQLLVESALGDPEAFRGFFHVVVLFRKN